MRLNEMIANLHEYFKHHDKTISYAMFKKLDIFKGISEMSIGNLYYYLLSQNAISNRFVQYRGDYKTKVAYFTIDLSKLYELRYETEIRKPTVRDKKPLDYIANELYNDENFHSQFTREQLVLKLINITKNTSRNAINSLIRELCDHNYIELDYDSVCNNNDNKKTPNDQSHYIYCLTGRRTGVKDSTLTEVIGCIKSNLSDFLSFIGSRSHNGYLLSAKRLVRSLKTRTSYYMIRKAMGMFISTGQIDSQQTWIYATNERISATA